MSDDDPPFGCFSCRARFWDDDRFRADRDGMEVEGLTVRSGGRRIGRVEWLDGGHLWIVGLDGVLLFLAPLYGVGAFVHQDTSDDPPPPGRDELVWDPVDDAAGDPWARRRPDLTLMRAAAARLETAGGVTPIAAQLRRIHIRHIFEPRAPLV